MYVTTMLPLIMAESPWKGDFSLFALGRFFLIYSICIIFDYRDREDDKQEGVRSLITYFSEKVIDIIFSVSLVIFALSCIGLFGYHYSAYMIFLLLIPGIIVAGLYRHAKKNFSDCLYYFVLDGLMMFSALLMLIFRI
jgi:4-hydroxybenzoate polyprenyltransferase